MRQKVDKELSLRSGEIVPAVVVTFQEESIAQNLEKRITHCNHYELAVYSKKWLSAHKYDCTK